MAISGVYASVCRLITSVFPYDISKTDALRIKLDTEMFHNESWKTTYCRIKRSKVSVTRHKNIVDVGHGTLVTVNAGFFYFLSVLTI